MFTDIFIISIQYNELDCQVVEQNIEMGPEGGNFIAK